ncbi:uncharacterized protein DUF4363 [Alkalibaculum bacchi]|uniref:Uncharacterized protein DUF4363 n=1 Tax=Alkalibaculum bacchi TaxID=645887 RepID=A0A366IA35_9FIRM|nr:DUF4363 family protein [Alkalibaculum bacchi]RBP65404.1 uncharacterized protein DUF4363 [Alkalibaculum bacchi]
MKPLFISIALVAVYLFGATYLYSEIEETSNILSKDLVEIQTLVKEEDWEESQKIYDSFKRKWKPTSTLWMTYVGHDEIDNIEEAIREADAYFEVQDVGGALENLSKLSYYLKHIYEKERISWYNIL